MKVISRVVPSVLLCAAVGLGSSIAGAASPPGDAQRSYSDLEQQTSLNLDRQWRAYNRERDTRPFAAYVEAKYVQRRDIGRGLVIGGASLGVVGASLYLLGFPRVDSAGTNMVVASYACLAVMGGAVVVGTVMWARNFRRLERIDQVGLALGPRGRVRLRAAGPIPLPRGAGFGLGLSF